MSKASKETQSSIAIEELEPFSESSAYYDSLYQDKDYEGEADYIHNLLKQYNPSASTLLEFGCGTGIHATLLAGKGFKICGFDINSTMIDHAKKRVISKFPEISDMVQFYQGDMTSYRSTKRFDTVVSLFSAICYQSTNASLLAAFETASFHLKPGGVFIFDAWYGPAVLTERPEVRVKRVQSDKLTVTRIAEPELFPNANRVDINFTYLIQDLNTSKTREMRETHRVRYLFYPEVESLFSQVGMDMVRAEEWATGKVPGNNTWDTCFIGRKNGDITTEY